MIESVFDCNYYMNWKTALLISMECPISILCSKTVEVI